MMIDYGYDLFVVTVLERLKVCADRRDLVSGRVMTVEAKA